MSTKHYSVHTHDVDGSNSRRFTTLTAAVKRFEEMVGYPVANAIAESFHKVTDRGGRLPTIEELQTLSGVSKYGTRVVFACVSDEAKDKARAEREAAAAAETARAAQVAAQRTSTTLALEAAFAGA